MNTEEMNQSDIEALEMIIDLRKENKQLKTEIELLSLEFDEYRVKTRDFITEVSKDRYEANPWTVVESSIAGKARNFLKENE